MGNADSNARNAYYNATAFPTVHWQGVIRQVGAGPDLIDGEPYRALINSLLPTPSYFKITVNAFDLSAPDGSIDLDIEVMETVPDISQMVLRMSITEDELPYGADVYHNVNRDMLPDTPITVDQVGQVQNVQMPFTVDPTWVEANLEVVAFIQDDADKYVHQSTSTAAGHEYSMRYYALGERGAIGPLFTAHDFGFFRLYNFGTMTDDFTVTLTLDGPADWVGSLCDQSMCYGDVVERTLAPGEYVELYPDIFPLSSGYAHIYVTFTQAGQPDAERTVKYMFFTDDLQVLLVDDDGAEEFEDYFTAACDFTTFTYGLWDRNTMAVDADILSNFDIVVWFTGLSFPTLDDDDRAALGTFMDNGGHLFATGQDIGWELHDLGGAAYDWYQQYLHANWIADDTNDYTLEGVDGDPVSNLVDVVIQGGDGANNQEYPDWIDAGDGTATVIWNYDASRRGAIRSDDGTNRVVYLGFGFEAIDNPVTRRTVMHRALNWLTTGASDVEEEGPVFRLMLSSWPNPVQNEATVRFTLPSKGEATLNVFGADGRLVRTLTSGELPAGNHSLTWNRAGANGQPVPAGVYYYRLNTGDGSLSRKTVVLR